MKLPVLKSLVCLSFLLSVSCADQDSSDSSNLSITTMAISVVDAASDVLDTTTFVQPAQGPEDGEADEDDAYARRFDGLDYHLDVHHTAGEHDEATARVTSSAELQEDTNRNRESRLSDSLLRRDRRRHNRADRQRTRHIRNRAARSDDVIHAIVVDQVDRLCTDEHDDVVCTETTIEVLRSLRESSGEVTIVSEGGNGRFGLPDGREVNRHVVGAMSNLAMGDEVVVFVVREDVGRFADGEPTPDFCLVDGRRGLVLLPPDAEQDDIDLIFDEIAEVVR